MEAEISPVQKGQSKLLIAKGVVSIEMVNITKLELQKLQYYFTELVNLQIHRFKNGQIIMHFDNQGELQEIKTKQTAWKRRKNTKGVDNITGYNI